MRRTLAVTASTLAVAAAVLGAAPAAQAGSLDLLPQQGRRIADPQPSPPLLLPRPGGVDVLLPPGSADLVGINCYNCRLELGAVTLRMPNQNIWNP